MFVEGVEAEIPLVPALLDPGRGVVEGLRLQRQSAPLRPSGARDKTGALEHLQVLGNRRGADRERRGDFADGCGPAAAERVGGAYG